MKLTITRPQAELWLVGSMLRERPEFTHDANALDKARRELPNEVRPEDFHQPLLYSAWLAVVAVLARGEVPTPEIIAGQIAGRTTGDVRELLGLLRYARGYADDLRANGRIYAKLLRDNPEPTEELHAA